MKRISLVLIIMIITTLNLDADGVGLSGIPALMMDSYGARAMGLGDTFVGIADDINTISVNPGGLGILDSIETSFMYSKLPMDMSFFYLAAGAPLSSKPNSGYFAGSIAVFSLADFDHYDSTGNKTGRQLSASDLVVTAGVGKLFNNNFSAGINVKYFNTTLVEDNTSSFCVDIGTIYKLNVPMLGNIKNINNLGIGFSIQNIGTEVTYYKEKTFLPRNVRIGAGYTAYKDNKHQILTGLDINLPSDSEIIPSLGLEYSFLNIIFTRIGYKLYGSEINKFSGGIGGRFNLSGKVINFDYAIIPVADFAIKHTFSMGMKFESAPKKVSQSKKSSDKIKKIDKKTAHQEKKDIDSQIIKKKKEEAIDNTIDIDAQINEKKKLLNEAVNEMDFDRAKQLKMEIDELEKKKSEIENNTTESNTEVKE